MSRKPLPLVLPDDDGIRPAGSLWACFYCRQEVGTPHLASCVCLKRRVRVRYVFELEIEVPHSSEAHDVEFHRNESSWCASNALDDLEAFALRQGRADGCLCDHFRCEVIEIPEADPYRLDGDGVAVP